MNYSLDVVEDDPYEAYTRFVNEYADAYTGKGKSGISPLMVFLISFAVAGVFLLVNCFGKKGKKTTTDSTYVVGGKPLMRLREDRYIRKSVTKTKIQTDSGSGGGGGHHTSAGGVSHGGAGHSR